MRLLLSLQPAHLHLHHEAVRVYRRIHREPGAERCGGGRGEEQPASKAGGGAGGEGGRAMQ